MSKKQQDSDDPFAGLKSGNYIADIAGGSPWGQVEQASLKACIEAVTGRGDALMIGVTSDGGAMSLCIFSKGQKRRFYEHDGASMDETLDLIRDWARNA